jgi:putative DNA primase/helicase
VWRVFVLSSGERSVTTRIEEAGQQVMAGQEVRLINLQIKRRFGAWDDCGQVDGAALSNSIVNAAASHYGLAGRIFLGKLTDDERGWRAAWKDMQGRLGFKAESADGQDQRVAARFALIALAGEVATQYGVLPWEPGTAAQAAAAMFGIWKADRGATGNSEPRKVIEQVRDFIERHGARFEPLGDGDDNDDDNRRPVRKPAVRDRAGWFEGDGVYLFTSGGLKEALAGFDREPALKVLADVGAIERPAKGGRWQTQRWIPGVGNVRICRVDSAHLNL